MRIPLLCTAALLLLSFAGCHRRAAVLPAATNASEPRTMLWAWETPEDLTTLDPAKTGVAFLAEELFLQPAGTAQAYTIRPRRQPLLLPANAWLMADVRLESAARTDTSKHAQQQIAAAIAAIASLPRVRAVQVDFDALYSQRQFYAGMLSELRKLLPPGMPLSITALVSWCGAHDDWLAGVPAHTVDEAVPMFFRMGGPGATRALAPRSRAGIVEPLCAGSVGVATDEAWPAIDSRQRVYLFRTGPWTQKDIARINALGYEGSRDITK
jgi:hypothetical protein